MSVPRVSSLHQSGPRTPRTAGGAGRLVDSAKFGMREVREDAPDEFFAQMTRSYGSRLMMLAAAKAKGLARLARQAVSDNDAREAAAAAGEDVMDKAPVDIFKESKDVKAKEAAELKKKSSASKATRDNKSYMEARGTILAIKEIFDSYDLDGSGGITLAELHRALVKKDPTAASYFMDLFETLDKDGSGQITFHELLQELYPNATLTQIQSMAETAGVLVEERPRSASPKEIKLTEEQEEEMRNIFKLYDTDKSNGIDLRELIAALRASGGFSVKEIEVMFHKYDTNKDNMISLDEFRELMKDCM